jgi:hypothetical protein
MPLAHANLGGSLTGYHAKALSVLPHPTSSAVQSTCDVSTTVAKLS